MKDKRLTKFTSNGDYVCCDIEIHKIADFYYNVVQKLAQYENTGLSHYEIKQLQARLENSVELPCKVGDTVYEVLHYGGNNNTWCTINPRKIREIVVTESSGWFVKCGRDFMDWLREEAFNKYWFLTKPEAEQQLEVK